MKSIYVLPKASLFEEDLQEYAKQTECNEEEHHEHNDV